MVVNSPSFLFASDLELNQAAMWEQQSKHIKNKIKQNKNNKKILKKKKKTPANACLL